MTKDQKADTGGDPWESRRPLIHCQAPGQGPGTREPLWKVLPTWPPRCDGHAMSEREIWQPNRRHLSADARWVAGSPRARRVCLSERGCQYFRRRRVRDVQTEEICADVSSLVRLERELLILPPAPPPPPQCLPMSRLHRSPLPQRPRAGCPPPAPCHPSAPAPSCSPPPPPHPGRWGFRGWSLGKWRCMVSWDAAGMVLG